MNTIEELRERKIVSGAKVRSLFITPITLSKIKADIVIPFGFLNFKFTGKINIYPSIGIYLDYE